MRGRNSRRGSGCLGVGCRRGWRGGLPARRPPRRYPLRHPPCAPSRRRAACWPRGGAPRRGAPRRRRARRMARPGARLRDWRACRGGTVAPPRHSRRRIRPAFRPRAVLAPALRDGTLVGIAAHERIVVRKPGEQEERTLHERQVAVGRVVRERLEAQVAEPEATVALGAVLEDGLHAVAESSARDGV